MHIAIVIPAYNESKRIGNVLAKLSNTIAKHTVSVIIVDDGSKDGTQAVAKKEGAHLKQLTVLRHKTNLGKGAAAKTGCDAAEKIKADYIVLMDADGQHNPDDIPRLLVPLEKEGVALVVGSRENRLKMPLMMRIGNASLSSIAALLFNLRVKDTQSGFRAFTAAAYPSIRWVDPHYAMETEMLLFAAAKRLKISEVPIATVYLDNHKGTTVLDGLRIFSTLISWKLKMLFHIGPTHKTVKS